jgi:hypothetical protein
MEDRYFKITYQITTSDCSFSFAGDEIKAKCPVQAMEIANAKSDAISEQFIGDSNYCLVKIKAVEDKTELIKSMVKDYKTRTFCGD